MIKSMQKKQNKKLQNLKILKIFLFAEKKRNNPYVYYRNYSLDYKKVWLL